MKYLIYAGLFILGALLPTFIVWLSPLEETIEVTADDCVGRVDITIGWNPEQEGQLVEMTKQFNDIENAPVWRERIVRSYKTKEAALEARNEEFAALEIVGD